MDDSLFSDPIPGASWSTHSLGSVAAMAWLTYRDGTFIGRHLTLPVSVRCGDLFSTWVDCTPTNWVVSGSPTTPFLDWHAHLVPDTRVLPYGTTATRYTDDGGTTFSPVNTEPTRTPFRGPVAWSTYHGKWFTFHGFHPSGPDDYRLIELVDADGVFADSTEPSLEITQNSSGVPNNIFTRKVE